MATHFSSAPGVCVCVYEYVLASTLSFLSVHVSLFALVRDRERELVWPKVWKDFVTRGGGT